MSEEYIEIPLSGCRGDGLITRIPTTDKHFVSNRGVWLDHKGYAYVNIDGKPHRLHRLILGVTDSNVFVDHINGDKLDNRLSNLRTCTNAENLRNRGPNSGRCYKGVYRRGRGWRAQIKVNRKTIHLGTYPTEEDAARAYDAAAIQYFGAFARLNFPQQSAAEPAAEATA